MNRRAHSITAIENGTAAAQIAQTDLQVRLHVTAFVPMLA